MSGNRRRLKAAALAAAMLGFLAVAAPASATAPGTPAQTEACVTNPDTPKRQFRALWVASVLRLDWPTDTAAEAQKAEYLQILDYAVAQRFNAVVVQVRPTADAFWPSPYEPWSRYLTGVQGQDPGYDPLAFLVEESHKRNLEFHAWFNPYRASMPAGTATSPEAGVDINKLAPNHPLRANPDWALPYPVGVPAASRLYYNPGIPAVREFVQTAIMDAVTRYDIDGVHFDDYFYPYPAAGQDFGDDATFAQYGAGFANKADWRRNNINLLMREMDTKIQAVKPWVKFGVSPFGIWRNKATDPLGSETNGLQSYDAISADTRTWIKEGWIDYVVPQVYWHIGFAVADYAKLVPWWSDTVAGTDVQLYIGQSNYRQDAASPTPQWRDPAEMTNHLYLNRNHPGVQGDVMFRAKFVMADPIGSTTRLVTDHYSRPALPPLMAHKPAMPLLFPVVTRAQRDGSGAVTLTWRDIAQGWPFGDVTSYAIYRFDGLHLARACDLADAAHLIATRRATNGTAGNTQSSSTASLASLDSDAQSSSTASLASLDSDAQSFVDTTAEPGKRYTYYVTSLDRLSNESPASPPRFVP